VANKFKKITDHVYRVVGEKSDGTMVVLQGPYANRGVARGQATGLRNEQIEAESRYGIEPEYARIFAQETVPEWFEI
jgi:hypothetical protein